MDDHRTTRSGMMAEASEDEVARVLVGYVKVVLGSRGMTVGLLYNVRRISGEPY